MKYLLTLLMMMFCVSGYCADINVSLDGTASVSVSIGTNNGTDSYVNDDDIGTESRVSGAVAGTRANISYVTTVTFDKAYDINKVELAGGVFFFPTGSATTYTIELYYLASWHTVLNIGTPWQGGTLEGDWQEVTAIRNTTIGRANYDGISYPFIDGRIFELRAYKKPDKGNYIISFL